MFRKIIETVVGTAIGLAAVYFVGKLAFDAGHEMAEAEHKYDALHNDDNTDSDETADEPQESELLPEGTYEAEYVAEDVTPKQPLKPAKPAKKPSRFGLFMGLKKMLSGGKGSVLGNLVSDPEDHKLEAYINEGEVHINIKKRRSITNKRKE